MSNSKKNIIGLIDFDGTLFETESFYDDCMDTLFQSKGITNKPRVSYKNDVSKEYGFVTGTGWRIIIPDTIEHLTGERPNRAETESLVNEFTDLVCEQASTSTTSHSYQASLEFCKTLVETGCNLSIHSGTEPEIVSTLLDRENASELFDVIVSSNKTNHPNGEYTRYKKNLMGRLMDHYKDSMDGLNAGTLRFFVLGDSNGDGFAANDLGLPFIMARSINGPRIMSMGDESIQPSMFLIVDGDGREINDIIETITQ